MRPSLAAFSLSLMAVALSGCAKDPFFVTITDCPAVAFVGHANTITRFAPGRYGNADGVTVTAALTGLNVECDSNVPGILTEIAFEISAKAGAAGVDGPASLPYFVATVRDGERLVAKTSYQATITLEGRHGRGGSIERVRHRIPNDELADRMPHEVLIGFELTEDEAAYNTRY